MLRIMLIIIGLSPLVPLMFGFTGSVLPLGESLAVFRVPNLLAACVLIPFLRKTKFLYIAIVLIVFSIASIAIHYVPQSISNQNAYRLYQKNLSFLIKDTEALKDDIILAKVDFITLQEVTEKNSAIISNLKDKFPYQTTCPFTAIGGVTVMSRWPSTGQSKCFTNEGMTAVEVETPTGPIWLISVHLHWPYPYGQAKQVKRLVNHIEALEGPKIIGGDFNMVPWAHTLKSFEQASDTQIARSAIHSLKLPYIPMTIPIDHILIPSGGNAKTQRRDKKGSDHFGVLAEFNLP